MRISGLIIGLIASVAIVTVPSPAEARVGVARALLSGGEDERLCRKVEQVLEREVVRLGHSVVEPAEIESHLEGFDRAQPLTTGEWIAVARSVSLDAVVVARMTIEIGQVALVLRVVFPDGPRDQSETGQASAPNAPYRMRELLEPLLGRADAEAAVPSAVAAEPGPDPASEQVKFEDLSEQDLAKVERAIGRDLAREYARFQRRGPHPPGAYVRYRIDGEEAKHKRCKLCAAIAPPAFLVVGGGLGTLLYLRGIRLADEPPGEDEDHVGIDEADLARGFGITLICVGTVGAFTSLLVCLAKMYTANGNLQRLRRLLHGERGAAASPLFVAPMVGLDGTFGAGAVVYF